MSRLVFISYLPRYTLVAVLQAPLSATQDIDDDMLSLIIELLLLT